MILTGIVGGYVNYILRSDTDYSADAKNKNTEKTPVSNGARRSWPNIVVGVSATLVVPLFLSTISSTLLSDSRTDVLKYFVFGGFCLLAAIFSKRFLSSMEKQILGKAQEAAEEKAKEVYEEKKGEQKAEFTEFKQAIKSEVAETKQNLDKINEFLQNLKSWESDYSKGTFVESKFEELFRPGLRTALNLEPDDKKDSRIFGEAVRFCYTIGKENVINELIEEYESYQNDKGVKLRIDGTTWTDFALANLNMFNYSAGDVYKANVHKGCDNALSSIQGYGVALIVKVFMFHLEDKRTGKNENFNLKKETLDRINNPNGNYSAYEAYSYMKRNEHSYLRETIIELMEQFKAEFELMLQISNEYAQTNSLAHMNMLFK